MILKVAFEDAFVVVVLRINDLKLYKYCVSVFRVQFIIIIKK